jgi:phosphate transport system substrate-binding protein
MQNNIKKLFIIFFFQLFLIAYLTGCSKNSNQDNQGLVPSIEIGPNHISFSVGSSLRNLMADIKVKYTKENAENTLSMEIAESIPGLNNLLNKTVSTCLTEIYAYDSLSPDVSKNFVDNKFCVEGYAIVTNKKTNIENLTQKQIIDIFTKEITNWKTVNSIDLPIELILPDNTFGSKIIFNKYVLMGLYDESKTPLSYNNWEVIKKTILAKDGAIGYLPLNSSLNKSDLKLCSIDQITPNLENIINGKYQFWSYIHIYSLKNTDQNTLKFVNYLKSDGVSSIVKNFGYIPLKEMQTSR